MHYISVILPGILYMRQPLAVSRLFCPCFANSGDFAILFIYLLTTNWNIDQNNSILWRKGKTEN